MIRQCAWCLRLIDSAGERVSKQPLPKLYEASHGMCGICGMRWMKQVADTVEPPLKDEDRHDEHKDTEILSFSPPTIAQINPLEDTKMEDASSLPTTKSSLRS